MLGIILTIAAMLLGVCFVFRSEVGDRELKERRPENPFWERNRY